MIRAREPESCTFLSLTDELSSRVTPANESVFKNLLRSRLVPAGLSRKLPSKVWDAITQDEARRLRGHARTVTCLASLSLAQPVTPYQPFPPPGSNSHAKLHAILKISEPSVDCEPSADCYTFTNSTSQEKNVRPLLRNLKTETEHICSSFNSLCHSLPY